MYQPVSSPQFSQNIGELHTARDPLKLIWFGVEVYFSVDQASATVSGEFGRLNSVSKPKTRLHIVIYLADEKYTIWNRCFK